jgi:hypothetical protein
MSDETARVDSAADPEPGHGPTGEAQRPAHLPRLRRCPCCTARQPELRRYFYVVQEGHVLLCPETNLSDAKAVLVRVRKSWPGAELVRIGVHPDRRRTYEVIRGGRWVDEWQGMYGRHQHESREWRRRSAGVDVERLSRRIRNVIKSAAQSPC